MAGRIAERRRWLAVWLGVWLCAPPACSAGTDVANGEADIAAEVGAEVSDVGAGAGEVAVADDAAIDAAADPVDAAPTTWRSILYPADWAPGHAAAASDGSPGWTLPDFSYAGYHHGAVDPEVPPTLPIFPVPPPADATATLPQSDSTGAIAAALAAASMAGGVVQLGAGTYRIDGVLSVVGSHVVLRGVGADPAKPHTRLWFTAAAGMDYKAHLSVGGPLAHSDERVLAADGIADAAAVQVGDATGLAPGDDVDVGWVISDAFVAEHGMTGTWKAFNGKWVPIFRRNVVVVDTTATPHKVTLDAPLRYPAKLRDKASLRRSKGWSSEVGIEDLQVGNAVDWGEAWGHNQVHAIALRGVKDAWVRRVRSFSPPQPREHGALPDAHLQSGGVLVEASKRVTIADNTLARAQHRGGGGNGYLFEIRTSSEVLTRDCHASFGRHNFIQNWGFGTTGCVWLRIVSHSGKALLGPASDLGTLGYAEFHHSLAMANLVDDSVIDDGWASRNRHGESSGAGHTSTRGVLWRVQGAGVLLSYNYGHGFVIGAGAATKVQVGLGSATGASSGAGTAPADWVEGVGAAATLLPESLYFDQRLRRIGR